MASPRNSGLGNKPIIVLIGLIGSLIAIFAFITGKDSLLDLLSTPTIEQAYTATPRSNSLHRTTKTSTATLAPTDQSTPTLTPTPSLHASALTPTLELTETPVPTSTNTESVASTSTNTPELQLPEQIFFETFEGNSLNENIWDQTGYPATVVDGVLVSSGGGEIGTLVYTKQNPFPQNEIFELTVKFQYTSLGFWAQNLEIGNLIPKSGVEHGQKNRNQAIVSVVQDNRYWRFVIFVLGTKVVDQSRSTGPHILRLVYDGKYRLWLDEELINVSEETSLRPSTIWIGSPIKGSGERSILEVDEIRIIRNQ